MLRVTNTLLVRNWEYVNYGFLLKGLSMDRDLERPGMNSDDQWRSDWIDCLVRDHILLRKLIPHRQNPDDLVPVIMIHPDYTPLLTDSERGTATQADAWAGVGLEQLMQTEPDTAAMSRRIVVSIEQFISFRGFTWCPLGSLHRRLRAHDRASAFQHAVEYLVANESVEVREYPNPESDFLTKGISLITTSAIAHAVLRERDRFICLLLALYERNTPITSATIAALDAHADWDFDLWFSIMMTENVLNAVPGRPGQYSLFRTHHTVSLVADSCKQVSA